MFPSNNATDKPATSVADTPVKCLKRAFSFDLEPIYKPHVDIRVSRALMRIRRQCIRAGITSTRMILIRGRTYHVSAHYVWAHVFGRGRVDV